MSFVKLENLNDFIQPSSACIKPAEKKETGVVAKVSDINLSDCLACSGCITSAETVLVQQQNHEELFKVINENKTSTPARDIVVSLSLQSISSIAYKNGMSAQEAAERIASFFVSIGCAKVYDINIARHVALIESIREFKKRREQKAPVPVISSICPGWICYAEKTNGDLIIPHLSRVRSPQQIMGAILKRSSLTNRKSDIYHVTLMPCFDKKLEASRNDFKNPIDGSPDVDCVLTPVELEEILNEEGVTLSDFDPRKLDVLVELWSTNGGSLTSHFGSVSGGYAENILLSEASEKFGNKPNELQSLMEYSIQRNSDFIEVTLHGFENGPRRFAIVNGFRNIQTIVQRLKRKALKYDYIEVMACPSGCINGGAQCKPNYGDTQSSTLESTRDIYKDIVPVGFNLASEDENEKIYSRLGLSNRRDELYTDFHAVPKMQNLTVNW